jgi:DeoR/GlpR family transcriptional regulator of sugar metabolism
MGEKEIKMKKHERLEAEKFLLKCIFEEDPDFVDRTMEAFSVSRSTVYNYINHLQEIGELERVGGSMPYRIVYRTARFTIDTSKEHSEDRIFNRDIAPLLAEYPETCKKSGVMPSPPC